MENSNFWDWDNEDEHRVSSVYRDADAENVKEQSNVSKNHVEQSANLQSNAVLNSIGQDGKEQNTVLQTNETQEANAQNDIIHDVIQSVSDKQTNAASQEIVTENNFILVDNPQIASPQTEPSCAQTQHQQKDCQQTGYQQADNQQAINQQAAYSQTDNQQNNFQQIIPIQAAQQNQGANKQKANHSKNVDYSSNFSPKDISENKVSAMAAYLLGPVGIIIALLIARDSAYTAFHVRQSLKITICSVVLEVIAAILALFAMIPLVGIIFKLVLIIICAIWFGVLILRLIAIAQVCDGEAREPAVIGKMNCFH